MKKRLRNVFDQYHQPENHITNSLLLVLDHNRGLLKKTLKYMGIRLSDKKIKLLSQVAPKKLNDKASIPDGYIYTDDFDFCIGIETKIVDGDLRHQQLIGHVRQLEQYNTSYLLVLSPDEQEPELIKEIRKGYDNIRFISWIDLLKFMSINGPDKKKENLIGKYLFNEFMGYMERKHHMTPFTGIKFDDGYDEDLARHYIKRISENITSDIINLFPECVNTRPNIKGAWQAWYSTDQVQNCVHPSMGIRIDGLRCNIILGNGCKHGWRNLKYILNEDKGKASFIKVLGRIYKKAPQSSQAIIACRQRHYAPGMKSVHDGSTRINIATLIGVDGSKQNLLWFNFLKELVNTKSKYNYQMDIGYQIKYDDSEALKTTKATSVILKCYRNLKEIYTFLSKDS